MTVLQDRVNRFLFGFFDEAAGIHDDHLGSLGITSQLKPFGYKRAKHDFRIDLIFGAAKIHEPDRGRWAIRINRRSRFRTLWNNQGLGHEGSLREGRKDCQSDPCGIHVNSPRVPLMIRTFQGIKPTVPKSCFVETTAVVIGDVVIGEDCSVWFHAVIRGDVNYIRIGDRTNVQDLCMLHVTHDTHPLVIGNEVTIGHHVVLHGCTIHDRVLVGMGAIIMDGAVIGEDSVVGAGALVVEGTIVPPKSLILGAPAKVKRPVTEKELAWIRESADNYVRYARQYMGDAGRKTGFEL